MIGKCIALLAIVAQINAYVCNSNYAGAVVGNGVVGSGVVTGGVVGSGVVTGGVVAGGLVGSGVVSRGYGVAGAGTTRNIVAKGKYPVVMDNVGPLADSRIPVITSHVQTPVQQKPTVRLSANIPAPRTVSHSCTCYKSILRPRVHDQVITVPSVQRYIETTHTPVVENIHYEAVPVNAPQCAATAQLVPVAPVASVAPVAPVASVAPVNTLQVSSVAPSYPVAGSVGIAQTIPVGSSRCSPCGAYY